LKIGAITVSQREEKEEVNNSAGILFVTVETEQNKLTEKVVKLK
jgi:hypothetical protein